ncbi:MAG: glycoside hydrolase, partial [Waterburya sp.]
MKLDSNQTKVDNQQQIKVVFVITGLNTGGAEMMLYKFLTRINRDRYAPEVIALISGGVFSERFRDLN